MGKISFLKETRGAGLFYDPYDELEAFNASRIFDDNEHTNINTLPDGYYNVRWNIWGERDNWDINSNRDVNNYKDRLIFMTPESYRQNRIDNLNTSNNIYNEKRIK